MIRCQACGTENLDGSQFCDECGAELSGVALNGESPNDAPEIQPQFTEQPVFQSANVTSIGIPAVVDEPEIETTTLGESSLEKKNQKAKNTATLIIERGESVGTEFVLHSDESNIGRWDADNGIFPDVDLDAHDPEAKVSRRHARIRHENGQYLIEDLGSTNGTFVNRGRRLIPGSPHIINDGDEIIVGKTFLRFYINE